MSRHLPVNGVLWKTRPNLNSNGIHRKLPAVGRGGSRGVHRQLPDISGGRGIFANYTTDLEAYMHALSERMRRVRVCCGDWKRILGPSPTTAIGTTAVFLDPPYASDRGTVYNEASFDIAHEVRVWAIENGENPGLRIALCGYDGDHQMPPAWNCIAWKANGGYGNQSRETRGRENAKKERIWFSPHCLNEGPLFQSVQP